MKKNQMRCALCNALLVGRVGKKICDHFCRSSFHNRINRLQNAATTKVVRILKRNRLILDYFYKKGKLNIAEGDLLDAGFNTEYLTKYIQKGSGEGVFYCFDYFYERKVMGKNVVIRLNKFA